MLKPGIFFSDLTEENFTSEGEKYRKTDQLLLKKAR